MSYTGSVLCMSSHCYCMSHTGSVLCMSSHCCCMSNYARQGVRAHEPSMENVNAMSFIFPAFVIECTTIQLVKLCRAQGLRSSMEYVKTISSKSSSIVTFCSTSKVGKVNHTQGLTSTFEDDFNCFQIIRN